MKLNEIMLGDARELSKSLPDESIDLVFTDPPYIKEHRELYRWLGRESERVLKCGGYLMCYAGNYWLKQVMDMVCESLEYYWDISIIHNGANPVMHNRQMFNAHKHILIFSKGKPRKHMYFVDVFSTQRDKRFHNWGQNEREASYCIHYFVEEGNTIWEPFAGGGTTPYICKQLGYNFYASEIDPIAYKIAVERLELVQKPLPLVFEKQQEMWQIGAEIP